MSNFSSPFMFKSPLNDLRKANSSRKTKKREPMKDCEGFECSKSEASLNRQNKTKTRTKTHIDNARAYVRSAAKDSAPLNQVDPDAPGTPGKPGYEPPVVRGELDAKGKKIYDDLKKENDSLLKSGVSQEKINAMRLERHKKKKEQK